MTAPAGISIGATWTAKRGKRVAPVCIIQIHRADRACTVRDGESRRVLAWRDLRKSWRPS